MIYSPNIYHACGVFGIIAVPKGLCGPCAVINTTHEHTTWHERSHSNPLSQSDSSSFSQPLRNPDIYVCRFINPYSPTFCYFSLCVLLQKPFLSAPLSYFFIQYCSYHMAINVWSLDLIFKCLPIAEIFTFTLPVF